MANRDLLRCSREADGSLLRGLGSLALVLALTAAACSSHDSGAKGAGSTTSSARVPSSRSDQDKADSAVLRSADFPSGWRMTEPAAAGDGAVGDCPPVMAVLAQKTGEGRSEFRSESGQAAVTNTVTFWPSDSAANAYLDAWQQVINTGCAKEMIRKHTLASFNSAGVNSGSSGAEIRNIKIAPLNGGPMGDQTFGFRATIQVKTDQTEGTLVGDYLVVRKGRATAGFEFGDVGKPLTDPRDALVRTVTTRLSDLM